MIFEFFLLVKILILSQVPKGPWRPAPRPAILNVDSPPEIVSGLPGKRALLDYLWSSFFYFPVAEKEWKRAQRQLAVDAGQTVKDEFTSFGPMCSVCHRHEPGEIDPPSGAG